MSNRTHAAQRDQGPQRGRSIEPGDHDKPAGQRRRSERIIGHLSFYNYWRKHRDVILHKAVRGRPLRQSQKRYFAGVLVNDAHFLAAGGSFVAWHIV